MLTDEKTRKEAEAMRVLDAADQQLNRLRERRDTLQAHLNNVHQRGNEWIEKTIRSFELLQLLQYDYTEQ